MNEDLFTLISTIVGGTFLANVVANRKNVLDDKQKIIDQLQEEREHFSEELKVRDVKIDELYVLIRDIEQRNLEILKEKHAVEWERDKLLAENSLLKTTIQNLEQRVSHLEKEEKEWKNS